MFNTTLYIEVSASLLQVHNYNTGKSVQIEPWIALKKNHLIALSSEARLMLDKEVTRINPFEHTRVYMSDWEVAEVLFRHVIERVKGRFTLINPLVVIHPKQRFNDALTSIEKKAFIEVGLSAGAREVVVYEGERIDSEQIDFKALKQQFHAGQ